MSSGEVLRLMRVYNDFSVSELASLLGISKSYLSEIENNKKAPTLKIVQKYGDQFGVKPSTILALTEELENPTKITQAKQKIANGIMAILEKIAAGNE